jgi:hypothetical protein
VKQDGQIESVKTERLGERKGTASQSAEKLLFCIRARRQRLRKKSCF